MNKIYLQFSLYNLIQRQTSALIIPVFITLSIYSLIQSVLCFLTAPFVAFCFRRVARTLFNLLREAKLHRRSSSSEFHFERMRQEISLGDKTRMSHTQVTPQTRLFASHTARSRWLGYNNNLLEVGNRRCFCGCLSSFLGNIIICQLWLP